VAERRCPRCGSSHPAGARFCPTTGERLGRPPSFGILALGSIVGIGMLVTGLLAIRRDEAPRNYPTATSTVAASSAALPTATPPSAEDRNTQSATAPPTATSFSQSGNISIPTLGQDVYGDPLGTPTAQPWSPCPDSPPSRLRVGDRAFVSYDPPLSNRVRADPGTQAEILGHIPPGEELSILGGPECADTRVWWRISSQRAGLVGWTAEGDGIDYWLVPLP